MPEVRCWNALKILRRGSMSQWLRRLGHGMFYRVRRDGKGAAGVDVRAVVDGAHAARVRDDGGVHDEDVLRRQQHGLSWLQGSQHVPIVRPECCSRALHAP